MPYGSDHTTHDIQVQMIPATKKLHQHSILSVNDGVNNDMDEVGVGEQGSTSRQFHPRSGEAFSS